MVISLVCQIKLIWTDEFGVGRMMMADEGVEDTEARVSQMVGVISAGTFDADPLSLSSADGRVARRRMTCHRRECMVG